MPVLVLHGDNDMALGVELLDGIEAVAPHSTVKVLKNCSHWCVCRLVAGGGREPGSEGCVCAKGRQAADTIPERMGLALVAASAADGLVDQRAVPQGAAD